MNAHQIVTKLLEDGPQRACVQCEIEHGIFDKTNPTKSHGWCKRHLTKWLTDQGMPPERVNDAVQSTAADQGFPQDLGPVDNPPPQPKSFTGMPAGSIFRESLETRYPKI
jgi:hypothetical protein